MGEFREIVEIAGALVDGPGVLAILIGLTFSTVRFVRPYFIGQDLEGVYRRYRQGVGSAILIGLELLVAGDIIRTVAVSPTLEKVAVLGIIVLIRTFLSISLQVELEGKWPWQKKSAPEKLTK